MKNSIYIIAVLIILTKISVAQQSPEAPKKSNFNWGIGIGYLNTKLRSENIKEDETLVSTSKNHPAIEINVSRLLGDHFQLATGITFLQYSLLSTCEGTFKSAVQKTDTDGYYYHPYYYADFTIERKITTIAVPIGIKILVGNPGKTRLQLETGIQAAFKISSKFIEDGHDVRMGLYDDSQYYNVHHLLDNVPRLNYGYQDVDRDTSLPAKSLLLNYYISAGIVAPISQKVDIYIKGFLSTGLQDITPSKNQGRYTNFMGEPSDYKKTTLFAAGIIAGILLR